MAFLPHRVTYIPEPISHQIVDNEADLNERVAVRLGHPVNDVAHQVLQRVGRTIFLWNGKNLKMGLAGTRLGTSRAGLEPSQAFSGLELAVFYLRVLKVFEMALVEVKYIDFFLIFDQIWLDNGF